MPSPAEQSIPVAPALSSESAPDPADLIAESADVTTLPVESAPIEPAPSKPTAAAPAPVATPSARPAQVDPSAAKPAPAEPTPVEVAATEAAAAPTAEPDSDDPAPAEVAATEAAEAPHAQPDADDPAPVEVAAAEAAEAPHAQPDADDPAPVEVAAAEAAHAQPATDRAAPVGRPLAVADEGSVALGDDGRLEPWAKLIADPGHAPELLALAAVQSIGPRAQEWLDRAKHAYPNADQAALARLATNQFTRAGGLGSIFGAVAGSYAPVALLGTAAVAHAELILHVAAAYGKDPLDPERAVDLLVLTHVHPDRAGAEAALAAARRPAYDEDGGLSAAVWRLSRLITTRIGGWGVVRLINRYLPGVSLLTAFLTSRAAADTVAARANAHYRREPDS